jgi:hypothetical protein
MDEREAAQMLAALGDIVVILQEMKKTLESIEYEIQMKA